MEKEIESKLGIKLSDALNKDKIENNDDIYMILDYVLSYQNLGKLKDVDEKFLDKFLTFNQIDNFNRNFRDEELNKFYFHFIGK